MDRKDIQEQIARILQSDILAGKTQLKRLLQVLRCNLEFQSTLKPESVIQGLWPGETNTKSPAHVATEMNRLRRVLEVCYSDEGKNDPILISLPNRANPGPDKVRERRWIVAEPRGTDGTLPSSVDAQSTTAPPLAPIPPIPPPLPVLPAPEVSSHRRLKAVATVAAAVGMVAGMLPKHTRRDRRPKRRDPKNPR